MHGLLTTQWFNTCGEFVSWVFKWKITDWSYTMLQSIFQPCISRTAPSSIMEALRYMRCLPAPPHLFCTPPASLQTCLYTTEPQVEWTFTTLQPDGVLCEAVLKFQIFWCRVYARICSHFLPLKLRLLTQLLRGRLFLSLSWAEFWTRYLQRC